MLDNEDYKDIPNFPPAAKAQLDTMLGLEHWDLTDLQRTWLYIFCTYNSYSARCYACGGQHKPIEALSQSFDFNNPREGFTCPFNGSELYLFVGAQFGSTELILKKKEN